MTIRGKLTIGLVVFSALSAAIGVYAIGEINRTKELAVETYNKPFMAINFGRAAHGSFWAMETALLRFQLGGSTAPAGTQTDELNRLFTLFGEDLEIARERSQSSEAVDMIDVIFQQVTQWRTFADRASANGIDAAEWQTLNQIRSDIRDNFEFLTDQIAGDGFVMRQKAIDSIPELRRSTIIAIGLVIAIAIVISVFLGRSILVPLREAVSAAERISRGELTAEIPRVGGGEMDTLLRSMSVMQENLRSIMQREEDLRKSAQIRLVDAIENSPEGIVLLDRERRIVVANSQFAAYFSIVEDSIVPGASFQGILDDAVRCRLLAASGSDELELRCLTVRPNMQSVAEIELADERWLRFSFSRARDDGTVVVCSDITALIRREGQLKLAKEEAEAANQAKSNFLANMSHELRTPLNAVIGFSDILRGQMLGPVGNAKYVDYAQDIHDSGEHLLRVINDILDLSKIEAGKLIPTLAEVDPRDCIDASLRLISGRAEEQSIEIRTAVADDVGTLMADARMLKQILMNLLSNATKFTPEGGRIDIVADTADDGGLAIRISDTGIGMSEDEIETALQPFGQVDSSLGRKYEGTGLGLPLTKRMIELHGGSLSISSEPGAGTTVTLLIPCGPVDIAFDGLAEAASAAG